jgi:hypothetical protein
MLPRRRRDPARAVRTGTERRELCGDIDAIGIAVPPVDRDGE